MALHPPTFLFDILMFLQPFRTATLFNFFNPVLSHNVSIWKLRCITSYTHKKEKKGKESKRHDCRAFLWINLIFQSLLFIIQTYFFLNSLLHYVYSLSAYISLISNKVIIERHSFYDYTSSFNFHTLSF